MPTVNARLQSQAIDRAVDLHRYSVGVVQRMIAVLNRTDNALASALTEALMRMDRDSFTVERLEALLTSVREINRAAFDGVFTQLAPELRDLAEAEVAYQQAAMRATVPSAVQLRFPIAGVSFEQVYAAAMSRPFQGRLLSGWAASLPEGRLSLIRNAVRSGFMEGRTTSQIVQGIRGTRALKYADGLLNKSRREVATIVQTALSHTAQTARSAFVEANADLVKAVKWTSTLDNKTSPMCQVRDGLTYAADGKHAPVGHKIPWLQGPGRLHFNCRSVSVPVTKSWRELGISADEMPVGTRASMGGQVPADTTYAQWFARQSAARQDEIVGPVRGDLFRAGKVSFDKFSDDKGSWLPLGELKRRSGL